LKRDGGGDVGRKGESFGVRWLGGTREIEDEGGGLRRREIRERTGNQSTNTINGKAVRRNRINVEATCMPGDIGMTSRRGALLWRRPAMVYDPNGVGRGL